MQKGIRGQRKAKDGNNTNLQFNLEFEYGLLSNYKLNNVLKAQTQRMNDSNERFRKLLDN